MVCEKYFSMHYCGQHRYIKRIDAAELISIFPPKYHKIIMVIDWETKDGREDLNSGSRWILYVPIRLTWISESRFFPEVDVYTASARKILCSANALRFLFVPLLSTLCTNTESMMSSFTTSSPSSGSSASLTLLLWHKTGIPWQLFRFFRATSPL